MQCAANCFRCTRQGGQDYVVFFRIKQPVELRAADIQTPGHFDLGDILSLHFGGKLIGKHAFDGSFGSVLKCAMLLEEVSEELPGFS